MKTRLTIITVFFLPLLLYGILAYTNPDTAQEMANSYKAMAQKAKTAKIIKFSVPFCLDCQKLDTKLDKIMPKYSKNVYLQRVDATSKNTNIQNMVKQYRVKVAPTTVFINSQGKVVKKVEGDIPEKDLEANIKALF